MAGTGPGFFQAFRPHGQGLASALAGCAGADEIVPRLLEVYEATASGWDERDGYFVVKAARPLSTARAKQLASTHLQQFSHMARAIGARELLALLDPLPRIEVVQGQTPWPPGPDDPEVLIQEASADYMASLAPVPSDLLHLDQALYHIACDYYVRDHILWPLYRSSSTLSEPFRAYFELWTHGAGMRFVDRRCVRVFVPALVA